MQKDDIDMISCLQDVLRSSSVNKKIIQHNESTLRRASS